MLMMINHSNSQIIHTSDLNPIYFQVTKISNKMYKNLGYDGEPNVMEEDKQVLYKCLAEYKLRLPMTQPANIDADMWEQLKELNEVSS